MNLCKGVKFYMIYVISDIHGQIEKYIAMLEKINLSDSDTLYVLGDIVDRGKGGIEILFDMMKRPNVIPILGNHEYMMVQVLKQLLKPITDQTISEFNEDKLLSLQHWLADGGDKTLEELKAYSVEDKEILLDYITEEFSLLEKVTVNNNTFILTHAGLDNFSPKRGLESYDLHEVLFKKPDYSTKYYDASYLVTGHTPTFLINPKNTGKIFKENMHIAIDCGAAYPDAGGRLGCICLNTLEEFYVE